MPRTQAVPLPRPTGATLVALVALLAAWAPAALWVQWLGGDRSLLALAAIDVRHLGPLDLLRLPLSALVHEPAASGFLHVLSTGLGLYLFGPALEAAWGRRRLASFLVLVGVLSALAGALGALLGLSLGTPLLGGPLVYGGGAVASALAVAWGLLHRSTPVSFFGGGQLKGVVIAYAAVGFTVLSWLTSGAPSEGALGVLAGLGLGWALGASTPSPARRLWLRLMARRAEQGLRDEAVRKGPQLRVIKGGKVDDKRYLN